MKSLIKIFDYFKNKRNPETFEEAIDFVKKSIKRSPDFGLILKEDSYDTVADVHHTYGRLIRNKFELWTGSKLKNELEEMGLRHPDDMSSIIIFSALQDLKGKPRYTKERIDYYNNYWNSAEEKKVKNTLIITVGLPRSGKSTWASKQGFPIVCPDSIRLALHGHPFIKIAEPFVWAIAKVMVSALFLSGHEIVILDSTCTTKERRNEWKSNSWDVNFKVLDTSVKECIKRAKDSEQDYLIQIIKDMSIKYEPVSDEEGKVLL